MNIRLDFDTKTFADQMKDLADPKQLDAAMGAISKFWWTEIQHHYETATPAIKESTALRWGAHPVLQNPHTSGMLRGRILRFVRERGFNNFVCGVYDDAPHGFWFDNKGRKAGFGARKTRTTRRGRKIVSARRLSRGEKRMSEDALRDAFAESGTFAWGAMAPRPFMFVDDVMEAYANKQMDDWMLGFNPS